MKRGELYMTMTAKLPESFLRECKRVRNNCGLTLKDLSERWGFTRSNISEFENGRNKNGVIAFHYILDLHVDPFVCCKEEMRR